MLDQTTKKETWFQDIKNNDLDEAKRIEELMNLGINKGMMILFNTHADACLTLGTLKVIFEKDYSVTNSFFHDNLFSNKLHSPLIIDRLHKIFETECIYSTDKVETFLLEIIDLFKINKILKLPKIYEKRKCYTDEPINKKNIKCIAKNISSYSDFVYLLFQNVNVYNDALTRELINSERKSAELLLDRKESGISIITAFHTHSLDNNVETNEWTNIYDIKEERHAVSPAGNKYPLRCKKRAKYIELIKLLSKAYSNHYVIMLDIKKDDNDIRWFANRYFVTTLSDLLKRYKAKEMCYFYLFNEKHTYKVLDCLDSINGRIVEFEGHTTNVFNGYFQSDGFNLVNDYLLMALAKEYGYTKKDKDTICI